MTFTPMGTSSVEPSRVLPSTDAVALDLAINECAQKRDAQSNEDMLNSAICRPAQDKSQSIADVDHGLAPNTQVIVEQLPERPPHAAALENHAPTSALPAVDSPTSHGHEVNIAPSQDLAPQQSMLNVGGARLQSNGDDDASRTAADTPTDFSIKQSDAPTVRSLSPPKTAALQNVVDPAGDTACSVPASTTTMSQVITDVPITTRIRQREEFDSKTDNGPSAKRVRTTDGALEHAANGQISIQQTMDSHVDDAPEKRAYDSQSMTTPQRKFLKDRLRYAKKQKDAAAFVMPVDPEALKIPHYPTVIQKPMDLSTLETKHRTEQYPSVHDFMSDFYLMIDNCHLFNGRFHQVTQSAFNLQRWFEDGMVKLPGRDADVKAPRTSKKVKTTDKARPARNASRIGVASAHSPTASVSNNPTCALQADGTPLIRRGSSTADGRPKREIHRPPSKDLSYSFTAPRSNRVRLDLRMARGVVEEMLKQEHRNFSKPFLQPVDPVALMIPDYPRKIKKPMDLGTIQRRLKCGEYDSATDVKADIDLMFQNCYAFNPKGSPVRSMGEDLERVYKDAWKNRTALLEEQAPALQSASTSDGYDEAESEEIDEEEQKRISSRENEIAHQIMILTQEQLKLQAMKGKPSRARGKKASKKDRRQARPKRATRPAGATKAKKRSREITLKEKKLISERIAHLDEGLMAKAVQIIRNGVPTLHLENINDDELELDIDSIPNDVLHELLKYIQSVCPHGPAGPDAASTYDEDYEPPSNRNTAAQPRKNKPMGKHEQEQAIAKIKERLNNFNNGDGGSDQSLELLETAQRNESSDDESSASESEEE